MTENLDFPTALQSAIERLGSFTLGVESAASYHGISPTWGLPLTILSTEPLDVAGLPVEVVIVPDIELAGSVQHGTATVTGVEQTIVDMLRFDRSPQTIVESLCDYYFSRNNTWGTLPEVASRFNILEDLESYYDDAIEHAQS